MKKLRPVLILLIFPVMLIILSLLYKKSIGEYFLRGFYDPAYGYLFNSLNLAQASGYGVGHYDHPGTTVQVLGAIVIKFFYSISGSNTDIVNSVLLNPEYYLNRIFYLFVFLNFIALFILGIIAYKKLNDIKAALILQLTPFFFSINYYVLTNVSPEPMMIFIILILLAVTISYINDETVDSKKFLLYSILFGVICGFGLATKISLFPLLIIPFILIKKNSLKILFIFVTIISFLIFIIPAFTPDQGIRYFGWIKNVITHSGKYGEGSESFIESSKIIPNLRAMYLNEPLFLFSYFIIFITIVISFFKKYKQQARANKYYKLLLGIFLSMSLQIIIVIKHFEIHYLIPALMLCVMGLFCVNSILYDLFPDYYGKRKLTYLILILIVFSYMQAIMIKKETMYFKERRSESHAAMDYLKKNYDRSLVITTYGASGKEFPSYWGVFWSGTQKNKYYEILKKMYPNFFYFNIWSKDFDGATDQNYVKTELIKANKFIFHGESKAALDDFITKLKQLTGKQNVKYTTVYSNSMGEALYEITLDS